MQSLPVPGYETKRDTLVLESYMKGFVITGSSRGIGLGLAESFLRLGAGVTLNGRSFEALAATAERLRSEYGTERVLRCGT